MRFSFFISALLVSCCAASNRDQRHSHLHRGHRNGRGHGHSHSLGGRSPDGREKPDASAIYKPINVVTSRSTGRVETRDTTRFANMEPADKAHMLFGKAGDNEELHLADMVLHAQTGLPIVMMEAFEGLTSAVDCEGDDGQLSLTFLSAEAFNHSLDSWSYVKEDTDKQFLMITNHDGCGPEDERQAYKISDVDNDEAKYIVKLKASPAPWGEIAGSFDIEFGKTTLDSSTKRSLRARGIGDWFGDTINNVKDGAGNVVDDVKEGVGGVVDNVEDKAGEVVDGVQNKTGEVVDNVKEGIGGAVDDVKEGVNDVGNSDLTKSISVPFRVGEENKETLLFKDFTTQPSSLSIFCTNCFVDAKFETTGIIKVENFEPSTIILDVVPQDFRAALELRAEVIQKNPNPDALTYEKALWEAAIPYAGIVVPKIFTLGTKVALNIQGSAMAFGTTKITFGGKTSLPNGSKVSVDLVNYEKSSITGFETADVEPVFDFDETSITANFLAGPQAALTFGVDILDKIGIEAALTFGTPTFNLNVTAGYDENGFCESDPEVTSGLETVSAANFDMNLAVTSKASEGKEDTLFRQRLVNIPIATFLDKCKPIPGLTPPNSTDVPEVSKAPDVPNAGKKVVATDEVPSSPAAPPPQETPDTGDGPDIGKGIAAAGRIVSSSTGLSTDLPTESPRPSSNVVNTSNDPNIGRGVAAAGRVVSSSSSSSSSPSPPSSPFQSTALLTKTPLSSDIVAEHARRHVRAKEA